MLFTKKRNFFIDKLFIICYNNNVKGEVRKMDINSIHGAVFHIVYDNSESKTEEYRQKYQDAMDEVQRLNRVIDELKEQLQSTEKKLHYAKIDNDFLSDMVANLIDEVNALYVKLNDFNN